MVDPRVVLPPHMARLVAANDAAKAREAERAQYAQADAAQMATIMARHQEDIHEAMTGVDSATWLEAQQARNEALAAAEPPARPELLVDGAPLTAPAASVEAATARRYEDSTGLAALLRRAEAEARAGAPVIARARAAARQREIRRLERQLGDEHRHGAVTAGAGGRVAVRSRAAGDVVWAVTAAGQLGRRRCPIRRMRICCPPTGR